MSKLGDLKIKYKDTDLSEVFELIECLLQMMDIQTMPHVCSIQRGVLERHSKRVQTIINNLTDLNFPIK